MKKEARFYEARADKTVKCVLCPNFCEIKDGKKGICLIRKNSDGTLFQTAYGETTGASVDPIEKKPLYHFYPGSRILSIGTNGCNFRCPFCQNWHISTQETARQEVTPQELPDAAESKRSIGIAYTYNEPFIWYEFVYDCAKLFRTNGLKNVFVSNGYVNPEPLAEMLPLMDAANIDLKGFTEDFYKQVRGSLAPVIKTIEALAASSVHLELTNLVIPGLNDDEAVFEDMCRFISSLSKDIPLHISRYFPSYKLNIPATPIGTIEKFQDIALSHLNYVYTGNTGTENDSVCPHCSAVLVKRSGYGVQSFLKTGRCPKCEKQLPFYV
jgi:pyruvate formate lyase activating enzyme